MSRIGKLPIEIPKGVEVVIDENNVVTVKGPLGMLEQKMHKAITITKDGSNILVTRPSDEKFHR